MKNYLKIVVLGIGIVCFGTHVQGAEDPNKIWATGEWIDDQEVLESSLSKGADPDFVYTIVNVDDDEINVVTWSPLTKAVSLNRQDLVRTLVDAGADAYKTVRRDGVESSAVDVANGMSLGGIDMSGVMEILEPQDADL